MRKKYLFYSFLLIMMICLSLCACTGGGEEGETAPDYTVTPRDGMMLDADKSTLPSLDVLESTVQEGMTREQVVAQLGYPQRFEKRTVRDVVPAMDAPVGSVFFELVYYTDYVCDVYDCADGHYALAIAYRFDTTTGIESVARVFRSVKPGALLREGDEALFSPYEGDGKYLPNELQTAPDYTVMPPEGLATDPDKSELPSISELIGCVQHGMTYSEVEALLGRPQWFEKKRFGLDSDHIADLLCAVYATDNGYHTLLVSYTEEENGDLRVFTAYPSIAPGVSLWWADAVRLQGVDTP